MCRRFHVDGRSKLDDFLEVYITWEKREEIKERVSLKHKFLKYNTIELVDLEVRSVKMWTPEIITGSRCSCDIVHRERN